MLTGDIKGTQMQCVLAVDDPASVCSLACCGLDVACGNGLRI